MEMMMLSNHVKALKETQNVITNSDLSSSFLC